MLERLWMRQCGPKQQKYEASWLVFLILFYSTGCDDYVRLPAGPQNAITSLGDCQQSPGACLRHVWDQLQGLLRTVDYHHTKIAELQAQVDQLYCPDEAVRDFIIRCARDPSGRNCEQFDTREIVQHLQNYPHRMLYFKLLDPAATQDPDVSKRQLRQLVSNISKKRVASLKKWAKELRITERTALLTLYMPYTPPGKPGPNKVTYGYWQAEELARLARNYFLEEVLREVREPAVVDKIQQLNPREVSCFERNVTLKPYLHSLEDKAIDDEPREGQARTIVWIFLVDCGEPRKPGTGS